VWIWPGDLDLTMEIVWDGDRARGTGFPEGNKFVALVLSVLHRVQRVY
jgi:hypothetical protein